MVLSNNLAVADCLNSVRTSDVESVTMEPEWMESWWNASPKQHKTHYVCIRDRATVSEMEADCHLDQAKLRGTRRTTSVSETEPQ